MVDLSIVMLVYQRVLCILAVSENADVFFSDTLPGSKYLLRKRLGYDLGGYVPSQEVFGSIGFMQKNCDLLIFVQFADTPINGVVFMAKISGQT